MYSLETSTSLDLLTKISLMFRLSGKRRCDYDPSTFWNPHRKNKLDLQRWIAGPIGLAQNINHGSKDRIPYYTKKGTTMCSVLS